MDKSLFDLYTDYLLCSFGPVTATGLSQLVDGAINHDQVTCMLAGEEQRSAHLWQKVKPFVRQVQQADGVISIDDSLAEKPYTDENDLVAWHWDSTKERAVKGINFLTAFYQVGAVGLPVAFDLVTKTETYLDPKTKKEKRRSAISKNARFRTLLQVCVHNDIPFTICADRLMVRLGGEYEVHHPHLTQAVRRARADQSQSGARAAAQKAGRYVAVETLVLPAGQTREIWLEEVPFALLLPKEVFINNRPVRRVCAIW